MNLEAGDSGRDECLFPRVLQSFESLGEQLSTDYISILNPPEVPSAQPLHAKKQNEHIVAEKRCAKCEVVKVGSEFFRDTSKKKTGLTSWCKQCLSASQHMRKATHISSMTVNARRCTLCDCVKSPSEFPKDLRKSGGIGYRCKSCCKGEIKRRKMLRDQVVVSEKQCTRCKQVKPACEFKKHSFCSTGLDSWCKKCVSARRKERPPTTLKPENPDAPLTCAMCKLIKRCDEFMRDAKRPSGRCSRCRPCELEYRKLLRVRRQAGARAQALHAAPDTDDEDLDILLLFPEDDEDFPEDKEATGTSTHRVRTTHTHTSVESLSPADTGHAHQSATHAPSHHITPMRVSALPPGPLHALSPLESLGAMQPATSQLLPSRPTSPLAGLPAFPRASTSLHALALDIDDDVGCALDEELLLGAVYGDACMLLDCQVLEGGEQHAHQARLFD